MVQIRVGYSDWGGTQEIGEKEEGKLTPPENRSYSFCPDMLSLSSLPLNSYSPLEAPSNSHGSPSPTCSLQ